MVREFDVPAAKQAAGLRISLFGPMEVRIGSRLLPRLRSRKGLWLLALLALRAGRPVDRDWLAATLWPECDEAHQRRSLRQSLHDLRLALGPEARRLICDAPRTLRLAVGAASVDVLAFDAAVARGDLDSLEVAVRLYRGPFLEDCAEEWSLGEQQRREQAYVAALERLASAATARQEHATAVGYLRLAVAVDPYREELQRALMRALAAGGNPAGALLVYRQFRARLWREMATEPAAETTALFRQLWDETRVRARPCVPAPPGVAQVRRRLPLPLTPLIGREEAVWELVSRLARARLVTLTGTGGIGKTRLALQVAEEVADEFRDGVGFVDLAPLADPGAVPEAVRSALGLPPGDARQETVEVLRQYLSPRRLLLVFDNCEHLLDACALLADALLCQCPGLHILATSRQALGLRGETVWRVPPLALPPAGDEPFPGAAVRCAGQPAPSLPTAAAVRLFVECARAAEASFEMTPHNAAAIVRVCRRLDGIPLAIELAAARVRSLTVEQIDARLRDGFRLLTGRGATLAPRQQTLAATFDWSWALLSPAERSLLRRLSVFAGGWTLAAAEAVCAGDGIGQQEVLDLLTSLVDRSLVVYLPAQRPDRVPVGTGSADGAGGRISNGADSCVVGCPSWTEARYHLLETVRQYAAERLRESDDLEATQIRHRDFFLEWAEEVKPKLRGAEQGFWFSRLETEHDNLRAALEGCRSRGDAEKELRLVVALCRFWDTCGHLREGRAHLEAALARMTPDLPYRLRLAALVHAGWMAYVQGDHPAARGYYGQALALGQKHGDRQTTADALNYLALVAMEEGDFIGARALFEESLALYRGLEQSARLGSVLDNLGTLAVWQGEYEVARAYLEQSAAWCEAAGDRQLHGLVLHDLSVADFGQGRYEEARAHCAASLRMLYECGAVVNLPAVLEQMALVAQARVEWGRAARLLGAAESLREAAGLPCHAAATAWGARRADAAAAAEGALGKDGFAAALAEGRAMDLEQAIAFALDAEDVRSAPGAP